MKELKDKLAGFPDTLPVTAQDWELYTSSMKCDGCAKRLTAKLKKVLLQFRVAAFKVGPEDAAVEASIEMHKKLCQEAKYGAADTEGCYHADQAIIDYGRMLGYDMRGEWF